MLPTGNPHAGQYWCSMAHEEPQCGQMRKVGWVDIEDGGRLSGAGPLHDLVATALTGVDSEVTGLNQP